MGNVFSISVYNYITVTISVTFRFGKFILLDLVNASLFISFHFVAQDKMRFYSSIECRTLQLLIQTWCVSTFSITPTTDKSLMQHFIQASFLFEDYKKTTLLFGHVINLSTCL